MNETKNFTKTFGVHVDVLMKSKNLIEDKQSVGGYFHHFCDLSKYLGADWSSPLFVQHLVIYSGKVCKVSDESANSL